MAGQAFLPPLPSFGIGLYMKRDRLLAEFMGDQYYHAERVAQLSGY